MLHAERIEAAYDVSAAPARRAEGTPHREKLGPYQAPTSPKTVLRAAWTSIDEVLQWVDGWADGDCRVRRQRLD